MTVLDDATHPPISHLPRTSQYTSRKAGRRRRLCTMRCPSPSCLWRGWSTGYDLRGKGTCLVRPSGASAAVVGAGPDCRVAGGCGRFQCPRGGCEGVGAGYHSGPVARSAFHPLRPSRWGSHGRFPATQQPLPPAMQPVQCRAGSRRTGPTRGPPRRIGAVRPRDRGASGARLFALGPRRWCRTPITAGCVWLPPIQDGDRC